MGVMERVRLEHVLEDAGVPSGDAVFVAWVDAEPERLRRLLCATLAKSPAERELVEGGYARWLVGLPREARASWGGGVEASTAWGRVATPGVSADEASSSRGAARWIGPLLVLVVLIGWGGWSMLAPFDGGADGQRATATDAKESTGARDAPQRDERGTDGESAADGDDGSGEAAPNEAEDVRPPLDLTRVKVAVPWPVMVAIPRAWDDSSIPWSSWGVGGLSLVVLVVAWRSSRRQRLLPAPAARPARHGGGRVQPELDRGKLPAFVERSEQETLVWGIGREVSERLTEQLDAERTVDETIGRGGLPQLWFQPAFEHRGVWLWRDRRMKSGQADAKRLEAEIVRTLKEAELPVHVATFARVPDSLQKVDGPAFSPAELDEQRRTTRGVVLTDGHGLLQARTAREGAQVQDLLRRLQGWHALAVVVFGERVAEVERMLEPYGIACLRPADAVAHLAGALREGGAVERERELLRWETACALAPRRIREEDALALRNALGLRIEGFAVDALRQRHGRGQHLVWSRPQRVAILADYDRAFGYRAMGWDAIERKTLLGRALAFWHEYYAQALAEPTLEPGTRDALMVERLVLGLWDRPEEVVRGDEGLYALFQTEVLGDVVRELVAQYTDVDGDEDRVRLPWRYEERSVDVQVMLGRMGFAVRHPVARVQRAGRWGWGLGLCLGLGVTALGRGMVEMMMPGSSGAAPEIRWVGPQPDESWGGCAAADDGWWRCEASSRFTKTSRRLRPELSPWVEWRTLWAPCVERQTLSIDGFDGRLVKHVRRCTARGDLQEESWVFEQVHDPPVQRSLESPVPEPRLEKEAR